MAKTIRLIAIFFAILAASYTLPSLYRTGISPTGKAYKDAAYSEILQDFIITEHIYDTGDKAGVTGQTVHRDRAGRVFTDREVTDLLTLDNVSQLAYEGRFPDTICGRAVSAEEVSAAAFTLYYSFYPGVYYDLHELRDCKSYLSHRLEPEHLFRIPAEGIEFIHCRSNRVDSAKSRLFREAFAKAGFQAPARRMWTPAGKSESEATGYYIIDNNEEIFQLLSDSLRPVVRHIKKPCRENIRNIVFSRSKEFTALFLTESGQTYVQLADGRFLHPELPSLAGKSVTLRSNLLYRSFTYTNKEKEYTYVFDREFHFTDSCVLDIPSRPAKWGASAMSRIFPCTLTHSAWKGFRMTWSPWHHFLWLNLILAFSAGWWRRRAGYSLRDPWLIADLCITALFGIYGLIGTFIFPLKKQNP